MKTITCTHHCACGRHFHSQRAFDMHRTGDFASSDPETGRRCLSPVEVLDGDGEPWLEALTVSGECRMYAEVEHGVTVWTDRGARERGAGLRLAGSSGLLPNAQGPSEHGSDRDLSWAA